MSSEALIYELVEVTTHSKVSFNTKLGVRRSSSIFQLCHIQLYHLRLISTQLHS